MSFDSIGFLTCFLPVLALLHTLLRSVRARNVLLLAAGLIFYAFGSLSGLALLLACAAVNYGFGLLLLRTQRRAKPIAAAAVILDLAFLAFFKYLDFALSVLFPASALRVGLAAPVGISFFTFRCISYIVDTARDRENGTQSFFEALLYVSFFPQLMAGPIARFRAFRPQLADRPRSPEQAAAGLRRFLVGLSKKLLLAGTAAKIADGVFAAGAAPDARLAWLGAAAYTLQIYMDFSGYSDMAIGLGQMFGFVSPENFNYPYAAGTITEFWRRWHISLSSWFRDYVYIPLGGSRKGRGRAALNKLIVFLLCGLWHGAGWTFLLWGLWHGVLSALETLLVRKTPKSPRGGALRSVLGHVYVLLAVCVGFVFFRAETLADGWRVLGAMLGAVPASAASTVALHTLLTPLSAALLLISAVAALPVRRCFASFGATAAGKALSRAACLLLLVLCIAELAAGGFSPFIYFRF